MTLPLGDTISVEEGRSFKSKSQSVVKVSEEIDKVEFSQSLKEGIPRPVDATIQPSSSKNQERKKERRRKKGKKKEEKNLLVYN